MTKAVYFFLTLVLSEQFKRSHKSEDHNTKQGYLKNRDKN